MDFCNQKYQFMIMILKVFIIEPQVYDWCVFFLKPRKNLGVFCISLRKQAPAFHHFEKNNNCKFKKIPSCFGKFSLKASHEHQQNNVFAQNDESGFCPPFLTLKIHQSRITSRPVGTGGKITVTS